MKKVLLIAVTIVAVIALGNVLLVSAQGGSRPNQPNTVCPVSGTTCPFSGTMPYGIPGGMTLAPALRFGASAGVGGRGMMGMHNSMMGTNGMHQQVWTAVAKELGLTYEELTSALQNGQTVAQLAQAKGVSLDALKAAALDAMKTSFAELVKQGVMTQQQADWMLDHMDDMPMFNFDQGFGPGMMQGGRGFGGMMGRGMMQNWQQPAGPQG